MHIRQKSCFLGTLIPEQSSLHPQSVPRQFPGFANISHSHTIFRPFPPRCDTSRQSAFLTYRNHSKSDAVAWSTIRGSNWEISEVEKENGRRCPKVWNCRIRRGILNEAGNEAEAYLPSAPPAENGMILRVVISSESHPQVQYWYLMLLRGWTAWFWQFLEPHLFKYCLDNWSFSGQARFKVSPSKS